MGAQSGRFDHLWHAYQGSHDEQVKADLTQALMPTIVATAQRVRQQMGSRPDLKDLIHAGVLGLLEAFERFDPAHGVYFETYCAWRVLGAMHDDQRNLDWTSETMRLKAPRLRRAAEEIAAAHGRRPTDDELAEALGISAAEVAELRRHTRRACPYPIDPEGGEASLEDNRLNPVRRILAEEARTLLLDALKGLPDKERYVLLLYYFERLTMAQTGLVLGVSESQVSRLHKKALATLVRRLGPRKDELLDALGA